MCAAKNTKPLDAQRTGRKRCRENLSAENTSEFVGNRRRCMPCCVWPFSSSLVVRLFIVMHTNSSELCPSLYLGLAPSIRRLFHFRPILPSLPFVLCADLCIRLRTDWARASVCVAVKTFRLLAELSLVRLVARDRWWCAGITHRLDIPFRKWVRESLNCLFLLCREKV